MYAYCNYAGSLIKYCFPSLQIKLNAISVSLYKEFYKHLNGSFSLVKEDCLYQVKRYLYDYYIFYPLLVKPHLMYPFNPLIKRIHLLVANLWLFLFCLILPNKSEAQSKWVIENYNYLGQPGAGTVVPMIHFETRKNWYAELRYNYEDIQTISFFGGKTFKGGKAFEYSITPLVGFSAGTFTGFSAGTNIDVEWKNIYLSSQTQYSAGTKKDVPDFFFSWSEAGYAISKHFFAGLAMQYTRQKELNNFEPGFVQG